MASEIDQRNSKDEVRDCKYLRDEECYVTGWSCKTRPSQCSIANREYMILDEMEEACMERPDRYVCHGCKEVFPGKKVKLHITYTDEQNRVGYYYCTLCLGVLLGYR